MYSPYLASTTNFPFGIEVDRAEGTFIYDTKGKQYFDLIAGISVSNLGHQHPQIIKEIKKQIDKHLHVMVFGEYSQRIQNELAENLTSLLPKNLNCLYVVNSGTEANEAALKLAKRATKRTKLVAFKGAYHGSTHGSLSVSANEDKKAAFRPLLPDVFHLPFNDLEALDFIDKSVAGIIIEPIQGDAGIRIPSFEFMKKLRKICDENCILLIFDEIQSGMGRTGKLFAFEHFDIVPDILTIGKAFGGGMPIGGFVTSQKLMSLFNNHPNLGHITTFGGHPVSCAGALGYLNVLKSENILQNVEIKGKLFEKLLAHSSIVEIRRKGLFFAIEMKNKDIVRKVVEGCKDMGVLSFWFLSCPESFRIAPPLNISESEIRESCSIINKVMDNFL
ncbi:MAG: aspartate aminotransferase family protein [Crocinitomicaceae bacterium]|nr:aspartate aminotransferase family protein [Crocinitomicaceae bacterium]|tara:strand:- start:677 stop:1846 length:1170 start_codon:yes stop_codon:yes gene_type:complete